MYHGLHVTSEGQSVKNNDYTIKQKEHGKRKTGQNSENLETT